MCRVSLSANNSTAAGLLTVSSKVVIASIISKPDLPIGPQVRCEDAFNKTSIWKDCRCYSCGLIDHTSIRSVACCLPKLHASSSRATSATDHMTDPLSFVAEDNEIDCIGVLRSTVCKETRRSLHKYRDSTTSYTLCDTVGAEISEHTVLSIGGKV